MKKLFLPLTAMITLGVGLTAFAQDRIIVKETPVVITKQGDAYIVPTGTVDTTTYYYYTGDTGRYVCTYETPADLANVQSTIIGITVGGIVRNVNCYPENYFLVQP